MSAERKPHSTRELLAEIRRGLIEMTDMPEAFDAFLKVERRVKELEEQLEAEKKWGRNQADLLTDCATENERLKEQLEVAERQRDSLKREADMYRADRDEYDVIFGRKKWGRNQADLLTDCATENERLKKMDALNDLREQKEAADRALRAIHFNASSWHAGEEGCRRALNVIQAWAAHPESVPEGVGEASSPASEPCPHCGFMGPYDGHVCEPVLCGCGDPDNCRYATAEKHVPAKRPT